jgi:hypothetical protein
MCVSACVILGIKTDDFFLHPPLILIVNTTDNYCVHFHAPEYITAMNKLVSETYIKMITYFPLFFACICSQPTSINKIIFIN